MPILVRQNKGKSIANSEDYDLANDVTEIVDSLNVVIPVSSNAERDALTPFEGMIVVRLDWGGLTQTYTGGAWATNYAGPFRQWFAVTSQALTGTGGTWTVNFPAGLFTKAPVVYLTKHSAGGAGYIPYVQSVSTSSVVLGGYWEGNSAAYTVTMALHAVQANPNAGGGVIAP